MTDVVLGIRLTLDGKEVSGEIRAQAAELQKLGQAAAQSNQQAKSAADQYLASLKRQAETLGMTKAQTLAYEGSQKNLTLAQQAQAAASIRAIAAHDKMQESLRGVKLAAAAAGAAIAAGFTATLREAIKAVTELQQSQLRLDAVLRATGGASGMSAGGIESLVGDMKKRLGIDDNVLRDAMANMLLFSNVTEKSFGEAIEMAANLSKVLRIDLLSAIMILGKALQDPEAGLTALSRAGVKFRDTQITMIKELVETGRQAEALTLILQIMGERGFGRVAETMNTGLFKALNDVKLAWGDLMQSMEKSPTAMKFVSDSLYLISRALESIKFFAEQDAVRQVVTGSITGAPQVPPVDPAQEAAREAYLVFARQFSSSSQKMAEDLKKLNELFKRGGATNQEYAKTLADIQAKYPAQKTEFQQLSASIREKTAAIEAELAGQGKLTDAEQLALKVMVALRDRTLSLKDAEKARLAVLLEELLARDKALEQKRRDLEIYLQNFRAEQAAREETSQALAQMERAHADAILSVQQETDASRDALELAEYEVTLMGRSAAERRELIEVKKADLEITRKINEAMRGGAAITDADQQWMREQAREQARNRAREQTIRDQFAEQQKLNDEIGRGLTDALMRGFESGKDFARNFRDTLVNMFKTLVLRPVIQWVLSPISGAISATLGGLGISGAASAAAGVPGGGDLTSALMSWGSIVSTLTTGLANASTMAGVAMGNLFGGSSAAFMVGQAIPYLGLALSAYSLVSSFTGGSGKIPAASLGDLSRSYGPGGTIVSEYSTSGAGGAPQVLDRIYAQLAGIADQLGANIAGLGLSFGANTGRQGASPNFALQASLGGRTYLAGETYGSYLPYDEATLQLAASRAILTALQGSQLPDYLARYLGTLAPEAMDQKAIDAALQFALALKQIRAGLIEARTPFELLLAAASDLERQLETTASSFKTDFVAAIDEGITPESLANWQRLGEVLGQVDQAVNAARTTQQQLVDRYTSDAVKLARAQEAVSEASAKYGVYSIEGFVELAQGLDVSTQSGQALLAELTALAPALDTVMEAERRRQQEMEEAARAAARMAEEIAASVAAAVERERQLVLAAEASAAEMRGRLVEVESANLVEIVRESEALKQQTVAAYATERVRREQEMFDALIQEFENYAVQAQHAAEVSAQILATDAANRAQNLQEQLAYEDEVRRLNADAAIALEQEKVNALMQGIELQETAIRTQFETQNEIYRVQAENYQRSVEAQLAAADAAALLADQTWIAAQASVQLADSLAEAALAIDDMSEDLLAKYSGEVGAPEATYEQTRAAFEEQAKEAAMSFEVGGVDPEALDELNQAADAFLAASLEYNASNAQFSADLTYVTDLLHNLALTGATSVALLRAGGGAPYQPLTVEQAMTYFTPEQLAAMPPEQLAEMVAAYNRQQQEGMLYKLDHTPEEWAEEVGKYVGYAGGGTASGLFVAGERGPELLFSGGAARVLSHSQSQAAVLEGGEIAKLLREVREELRAANRQRGAVGTETIERLDQVSTRLEGQRRELRRLEAFA